MEKADIVVIGAGLTGLSFTYHAERLFGRRCVVIEAENEVGGMARSVHINGFTFDYTGHALHLRNAGTKGLVKTLLGGNLRFVERDARIYSHKIYTNYPFQANTYGLPADVVKECVLGFLERPAIQTGDSGSSPSFYDWALATFGRGITRHFLSPYNSKLWARSSKEITSDWCGTFVPVTKLEDVVSGALFPQSKKFGYNPVFYYPVQGGIEVLPLALAKNIKDIRVGVKVVSVNLHKRELLLSNGSRMSYRRLVTTMPLAAFIKALEDVPKEVKDAAARLKWISVLCFNLGVARPVLAPYSWIYFPEPDFSFYRVGFPFNFSPMVVPKGCSSMYIEISHKPGEHVNYKQAKAKIIKGLMGCGILSANDKILTGKFIDIPFAYVVYDNDRKTALDSIFKFLDSSGIVSIGRYGAWKYSFMEENILDGKASAEKLCK